MEPLSVICLGGAVLVAAVNHLEKRAEKARRVPPSLPNALNIKTGAFVDSILVVHIGSSSLVTQFAKDRFKIRVKYGAAGESVLCETDTVEAEFQHSGLSKFVAQLDQKPQASATFDTTCLFLAVPREMMLRIRLVKASSGLTDHTVATAELRLPPPQEFLERSKALDVYLKDKLNNEIGHVTLNIGFVSVDRCYLRAQLQELGAIKQSSAFAVPQILEGKVVDSPTNDSNTFLRGESAKLSVTSESRRRVC